MIVPVPPLDGVKETLTTVEFNTDATPIVGEVGIVVISVDALDDDEVPLELVAVTENV